MAKPVRIRTRLFGGVSIPGTEPVRPEFLKLSFQNPHHRIQQCGWRDITRWTVRDGTQGQASSGALVLRYRSIQSSAKPVDAERSVCASPPPI